MEYRSFQRLDANGRPVAQYLCHAFHQLVRVIADADHCVGPRHMRLNQHCVESLLAGSLSERGKERDIAAKQRLHGGADGPENRSGSDDNTTYHAKIVHDSESRHVEAGRCHVGRNVCCLRMDDGRHESRFAVRGQLSCKRQECRPNGLSCKRIPTIASAAGIIRSVVSFSVC